MAIIARDPIPEPAPQNAATTSQGRPDPAPTSVPDPKPSDDESDNETPTPPPAPSPTPKTTEKAPEPTTQKPQPHPTVVETTVKSLQPTFTEEVETGATTVPTVEPAAPAPTDNAQDPQTPDNPETPANAVPTAIVPPTDTGVVPTTLLQATDEPSASTGVARVGTNTGVTPLPTSGSGSDSSSSSPNGDSDSSSSSDSSGVKAGIGLGVAGGLLLIILAIWLLYSRRKRQQSRSRMSLEDDEKAGADEKAIAAGTRDPRTGLKRMSLAPRLSLRRTTRAFSPTAAAASFSDRRQSKIITHKPSSTPTWDSASSSAGTPTSNNPNNPFGNYAERMSTPVRDLEPHEPVSPISASSHADYMSTKDRVSEETVNASSVSPIMSQALPAAPLTRKASARKDGPHALDLTRVQPPPVLSVVPPSPAGTEYSNSIASPGMPLPMSNGAVAIAAAGGPESSAVHRVLLDYVPSMDDEMQLQAGQFVRLLHEYDDGWAFCIRLDRSQQGVVPRTCLSVRPAKPRKPQGPNNNARPGPPIKPQQQHQPIQQSYAQQIPQGPPRPQALRPNSPQNGRVSPSHGRTSPPSGRLSPATSGSTRSTSPGDEYYANGLAPRPHSPSGMGMAM